MIFRRLKSHIESENWFAVFVDFAIVVSGVFIGIQVANWNVVRGAEAEYARSLARLETETQQNLDMLDIVEAEVQAGLSQVQSTLDAFESCDSADPEMFNQNVEDTLQTIFFSRGVHLRRNALDSLVTDPQLLVQQSERERQVFSDIVYFLDRLQDGSESVENVVTRLDVRVSPVLSVGPPETLDFDYFGSKANLTAPQLRVNAPMADVCQDEVLSQNLYLWISRQSVIPSITSGARQVLQTLQAFLQDP